MVIEYINQEVKLFKCDQEGIDQLKDEFFKNAEEFIYYRKGEWHGILATLEWIKDYLVAHPGLVVTIISSYPDIKILAKDIKIYVQHNTEKAIDSIHKLIHKYSTDEKKLEHITCRVITSLTKENEKHIPEWEKICGKDGVCIIPKEQAGYFRYFVNEKEFCLFCRIDENTLRGIRGNDPMMVKILRDKFDKEFFIGKYLFEQKIGLESI